MNKEIAVFGGGCFWCTEAVFERLKGVLAVVPGYAGGEKTNPTYEQVSMETTGHAEVIRVEYDPESVSYQDLLTVFFASHDPTTLNKQGNDIGTQYRSVIFTTSDTQKTEAERFISELNKDASTGRVVTAVKPLETFYEAEEYHHQYFRKNPDKAYCQVIINPKLEKVRKRFDQLFTA